MNKLDLVLAEIQAERIRQDAKWGQQNWPSLDQVLLTREGGCTKERMAEEYEIAAEGRAKALCNLMAKRKELTWGHILVEEVSEAICALDDEQKIREELVQVAAVAAAWIECIDRRSE